MSVPYNTNNTDDATSAITLSTTVSTNSTISHGGFDYELLGGTDSRFECPICLLYMRDPVITSCGHRFCSGCISQWVLNQSNPNGCPVDGGLLSHENIFPDNYTRREILACKAKCPYLKDGCPAIVSLADMEKHVELEHTLSLTNSLIGSLKFNGSPSNSNGTVECIFKEVGCATVFPPEQLQRHLESDVHHHLQLCTASYKRLKRILSRPVMEYSPNNSGGPPNNPELFSRQDSRDSTRWLLFDDIDSDEYNFRRQRSWDSVRFARRYNSRAHYPDRLAESDESLTKPPYLAVGGGTPNKDAAAGCSNEIQKPHYRLCSNGDDNQLKDLFERLVILEQRDREKQIKIDRLETQLSSAVDLFSKVTCLMDDLTARYCHGIFVWKLPYFHALCEDMRKNPSKVLTSPGFYTDTFGYKLCLRFNLSTQTSSPMQAAALSPTTTTPVDVPLELDETTFVSLYIHFMQGDFDDSIEWPFKGELKFTIVHPQSPEESLTECIRSKPEAAAFAKPTLPRNPKGFGYPDVCSVKKIFSGGYIKDDSLTFKILAKAQS